MNAGVFIETSWLWPWPARLQPVSFILSFFGDLGKFSSETSYCTFSHIIGRGRCRCCLVSHSVQRILSRLSRFSRNLERRPRYQRLSRANRFLMTERPLYSFKSSKVQQLDALNLLLVLLFVYLSPLD